MMISNLDSFSRSVRPYFEFWEFKVRAGYNLN